MLKTILSFTSLRKSKRAFRQLHKLYERKAKSLDDQSKQFLHECLTRLQSAILKKEAKPAKKLVSELEQASLQMMPKTPWDKLRDFFGAILFALLLLF